MEASALHQPLHGSALGGRTPLLRLQGDEKLVALTRKGQDGAFDALVQRYESRLLAFCRHMLGSREDAEDILQEVFAAAYNAMLGDERYINVRPWLYRIARNRCLNHLRKPTATGLDSMDIFERDGGTSTADTVHKREEFRQIVSDVHDLPETQRTALLLREIDALSYDQIAEAMDTTIPSVKSLLVRARVSLAEAAEARLLTCSEVRFELGQVAEGLTRSTAPVRRHLRNCERCRVFKDEIKKTSRALAAVYPIGPLVLFKKFFIAKLGLAGGGAGAAGGAGGAAGGAGALGAGSLGTMGAGAAGGAMSAGAVGAGGALTGASAIGGAAVAATAGGAAGGGLVGLGVGTAASKAAAGLAAAAIVTAGAVEVNHVAQPESLKRQAVTSVAPVKEQTSPVDLAAAEVAERARAEAAALKAEEVAAAAALAAAAVAPALAAAPAPEPAQAAPAPAETTPAPGPAAKTQEDSSTATLPARGDEESSGTGAGEDQYAEPQGPATAPPGEPSGSSEPQAQTQPAPPAGEPGSGPAPTP